MEIKKSSSSVNVVQENSTTETEKKSEKSLARGIASAKDSFEVSSSSNQENSGKKELGAAQQQEASKMNYKDFGNNGTASQDSRTRYEDAKNSGLVDRLGHSKKESDPRADRLPKGMTVEDIKNLNSPIGSEQTSDAVKDAQGKLAGDKYSREALDQEVAQRRQDFTQLGGMSAIDRLKNSSPDPSTPPKGKGNVPTGKDMLENKIDDAFQVAAGVAAVVGGPAGGIFGGTLLATRGLDNFLDGKISDSFGDDFPKKMEILTEAVAKREVQKNEEERKLKTGQTTFILPAQDGQSVEPDEDHPDGKKYVSPKDGSDVTPKGGSVKMPGMDDRGGNVPEDIKKSEEYFLQQIRNSKPKTGGETELTDGGVTGNSADGSGPINNAFTRTGGVMGAVGQPTRAGEDVGNPSNVTVGSAIHNGGATDPIDGNNWTGTTHQDDPADVQFGPAEQPKQQTGKKEEESNDSSFSFIDPLRKKKA